MSISGGDPGFGLLLAAADLIAVTGARLAHIVVNSAEIQGPEE